MPRSSCRCPGSAGWHENKRLHLRLPEFSPTLLSWAKSKGKVTIPESEREQLLEGLGCFDIAIGDEDVVCRKSSNYFFRDAEQVKNVDASYLNRVREERKASVLELRVTPSFALVASGQRASELDPQKERDFFFKHGATVAASVAERAQARAFGNYPDGRPVTLCRISGCFIPHGNSDCRKFLCPRHFRMLEVFLRGEFRRLKPAPPPSDTPASKRQRVDPPPSDGGKSNVGGKSDVSNQVERSRDGTLPTKSQPSLDAMATRKRKLSKESPESVAGGTQPAKSSKTAAMSRHKSPAASSSYARYTEKLAASVRARGPWQPPTFVVYAPPGSLGIRLENGRTPYVEVTGISKASPLVKEISVGDRIFSCDMEVLWQRDVTQVVALLNRKVEKVRRLDMLRAAQEAKTDSGAKSTQQVGDSQLNKPSTPAAKADSEAIGAPQLSGMARVLQVEAVAESAAASAAPDRGDSPEKSSTKTTSELRGKSSDQDKSASFALSVPPGNLGVTLHLSKELGAVIETIEESSPFWRRARVGDRIATIDGRPILTAGDLRRDQDKPRVIGITPDPRDSSPSASIDGFLRGRGCLPDKESDGASSPLAVETPLESADADMERFMDC